MPAPGPPSALGPRPPGTSYSGQSHGVFPGATGKAFDFTAVGWSRRRPPQAAPAIIRPGVCVLRGFVVGWCAWRGPGRARAVAIRAARTSPAPKCFPT